MSMPFAGRAAEADDRATHRPAPMSGSLASAKSRRWPAATAATGGCGPSRTWRSMAIWPVNTGSAFTRCWRTTPAMCWRLTSMNRTGVTTLAPCCVPAGNWPCRRPWRSPVPGEGGHGWVFFEEAISAREARLLVDALQQCLRVRQILGVRLMLLDVAAERGKADHARLQRFYASMGFWPLPGRPERLFISLGVLSPLQSGG